MATTTIHHFLILAFFLLSTSHFLSATSRLIPDDFSKQPHHRLSPDSSTNLDQHSLFSTPLARNKSMPTESSLTSFPTFLRPIIFPSPFGRFRPTFPLPSLPKVLPRFPPLLPPINHHEPDMPSKPSVPSDQPAPPTGPTFAGSPPAAAHP